jgi:hypothetical protein
MEEAEVLQRQIAIAEAQMTIVNNQTAIQLDMLNKRKASLQEQLNRL